MRSVSCFQHKFSLVKKSELISIRNHGSNDLLLLLSAEEVKAKHPKITYADLYQVAIFSLICKLVSYIV